MTDILTLTADSWDQRPTAAEQELAIDALERGSVLLLPRLGFALRDGEDPFFSPAVAGKGKNVSLDPLTGSLRGSSLTDADRRRLQGMLQRFAVSVGKLLCNLLPLYAAGLEQARTSFRPVEIAGRQTSWRKDDTRLHVDAFPSSPTRGKRILRLFTNVNPLGNSRNWRLGESFEEVARRYLPELTAPIRGADLVLNLLGITKRRRTAYDHYMLQLHDRMKADSAYQLQAAQRAWEFPAGSTWLVFTDLVSHAAMSGQYALEQTFHLPVACMQDQSRSPLRILEKLLGRVLV